MKRLSLVERQQQLLEEKGFSQKKSSGTVAPSLVAEHRNPSDRLLSRRDELLIKCGRGNATAASRSAVPMDQVLGPEPDDLNDHDGTKSAGGKSLGGASVAPSLHPSVANTRAGGMSIACSESTIGAGDNTAYWDYQHRQVLRSDLAHTCRECRKPFTKIGEPITERRGARTSMRFHAECFSGFADPRSQARSSHHQGRFAGTQHDAAPDLTFSKMRTSTHFTGDGHQTVGKGVGSQMAMGKLSFKRSDKGVGMHTGGPLPSELPGSAASLDPNALTAEKLKALDQGTMSPSHKMDLLDRVVEEGPAGDGAGPVPG